MSAAERSKQTLQKVKLLLSAAYGLKQKHFLVHVIWKNLDRGLEKVAGFKQNSVPAPLVSSTKRRLNHPWKSAFSFHNVINGFF